VPKEWVKVGVPEPRKKRWTRPIGSYQNTTSICQRYVLKWLSRAKKGDFSTHTLNYPIEANWKLEGLGRVVTQEAGGYWRVPDSRATPETCTLYPRLQSSVVCRCHNSAQEYGFYAIPLVDLGMRNICVYGKQGKSRRPRRNVLINKWDEIQIGLHQSASSEKRPRGWRG